MLYFIRILNINWVRWMPSIERSWLKIVSITGAILQPGKSSAVISITAPFSIVVRTLFYALQLYSLFIERLFNNGNKIIDELTLLLLFYFYLFNK